MMLAEYNHPDNYQTIDNTVVFWDWPNQRVKILPNQQPGNLTLKLIKELASEAGMGKIIAFALPSCRETFLGQGFEVEGKISGFFAGRDAWCYSYFVSPVRNCSDNRYDGIFPAGVNWDAAKCKDESAKLPFVTRNATPADIPDMISLFRDVFATYPSPVFDAEYLRVNMKFNRVLYKVAVYNNMIVGIASAEKEPGNLNAEITDCVTSPHFRGQGVLTRIISELEDDLYSEGYICLYTLCRSVHAPVNKAFFRLGYLFSGRLIKNCNICGSFEDMNILVKVLR